MSLLKRWPHTQSLLTNQCTVPLKQRIQLMILGVNTAIHISIHCDLMNDPRCQHCHSYLYPLWSHEWSWVSTLPCVSLSTAISWMILGVNTAIHISIHCNLMNDPGCQHCHSYHYPLQSHEWSWVSTLPCVSLSTVISWMIPGVNTAIHISIHCNLMNDPGCQHCHSYLYPLRSHEWSWVSTLSFISLSTAISWMILGVNTAMCISIHCSWSHEWSWILGVNTAIHISIHCNLMNDPGCQHCHSYLYPLRSHEWSWVSTLPFISLSTAISWMILGVNTAMCISIHCDLMNDPRCQHCHSYFYPLQSHEWSWVSTLPFISLSTAISWMILGVNTAIHISIHCDLMNDPGCQHCHSYLYPLRSHEWSWVSTLPFISLSTAISWMILGVNTAMCISIHCDLMNDPRCQHCHSYFYPLQSHEWSWVSTLPFISLSTAISWMILGVNTAIHISIHCDLMNDPGCQHCHSYLYPLRSHEWSNTAIHISIHCDLMNDPGCQHCHVYLYPLWSHEWSQVSTLPFIFLSTAISWMILGVNTAIHISIHCDLMNDPGCQHCHSYLFSWMILGVKTAIHISIHCNLMNDPTVSTLLDKSLSTVIS